MLSSHKSCNMIIYGCLKCFLILYFIYFIIILLLFCLKGDSYDFIVIFNVMQPSFFFCFYLRGHPCGLTCGWVMHSKSNYYCLTTSSQFQMYIFLLVLDFLLWMLLHLLITCHGYKFDG